MRQTIIPHAERQRKMHREAEPPVHVDSLARLKARLVLVGQFAIAHELYGMAAAITIIMRERGLAHE